MTPGDLAIRNATHRSFVELMGRAPTADEVAATMGRRSPVREAWRRLHDAHALVLDDGGRLLMANPFSAVETPHRVETAGRTWYANCGWDAFGIGVVPRADPTIRTTCPDCTDPIELEVRAYRPTDLSPVFHVLVPATATGGATSASPEGRCPSSGRRTTLTAGSPGARAARSCRSRRVAELLSPRPGGGTALDPDWRPHTREQNQAILDRPGLTGNSGGSAERDVESASRHSSRTDRPE